MNIVLLNLIIDLPEKYITIYNNLKKEDILACTGNPDDIINKIRVAIFTNYISKAQAIIEKSKCDDTITLYILDKYMKKIDNNKEKLYYLIKEEEYDAAIRYLENNSLKRNLSIYDKYTLKTLKDYVALRDNNIIPIPKITESNNLFRVLENKDYIKAIYLFKKNKIKENPIFSKGLPNGRCLCQYSS